MRLIIVSNRLPINVTKKKRETTINSSIGGLATGMKSFLDHFKQIKADMQSLWVGWLGTTVDDQPLLEKISADYACHPVMIPEKMARDFYEGFCNKTLWPLFHYFTGYTQFKEKQWQIYQQVNQLFCDTLVDVIQPGDIIWIHDYQLLTLPKLLRQHFPHHAIGFFLHIPFPAFEIIQFLPRHCREDLISGMLGADLVGFHTESYTQNFIRCAQKIFGYEQTMGYIATSERFTRVSVYPMGIDFNYIQSLVNDAPPEDKQKISHNIQNVKIILSIDRLDYTKGVPNRLHAYEKFLEQNPQWRKKVVFLAIIAPSREKVAQYQAMKRQVDELVGHINSRFGEIDWNPIIYQYKAYTLDKLATLFFISDVALITPIRDGMNLIAKEYVAAQMENKGVLILSETAGAAKELLDAIIINPNDFNEMATAIKYALEMSEEEKAIRMDTMRSRIQHHDVIRWGHEFIMDLSAAQVKQQAFATRFLNRKDMDDLVEKFAHAKNRLLLLDYDGTLVPFTVEPKMAKPNSQLLRLLTRLIKAPQNKVVIVSGRDKYSLEEWLGYLNIDLAAEHGVWIKIDGSWNLNGNLSNKWKPQILRLLKSYQERLPGTRIEEKEYSVVWHYRGADQQQGRELAKLLADHLMSLTANENIQILLGNKMVEAKAAEIGKDAAVRKFISQGQYDFILTIGDDVTDEDMFKAVPDTAYSIKVGEAPSQAKFNVPTQSDVIRLLKQLVSLT